MTPTPATHSPEQTKIKLDAVRAQEQLDLLFTEKREDLLTVLAYRLHAQAHQDTGTQTKPSWGESQALAAKHFDAALETLVGSVQDAASVAPAHQES